jgi:hypothetical protein
MFNGKIHYKWPFSIAILTLPEGNQHDPPECESLDPGVSVQVTQLPDAPWTRLGTRF